MNDPFAGCLIRGCQEETMPIDLFCPMHAAVVPDDVQRALDDYLRQKTSPSMLRWQQLVRQANDAVTATTTP
jgi:hypothetical protein